MEILKLKETKNILYLNELEEKWSNILQIKPLVVAIDFIDIEKINSLIIGAFVKYFNTAKEQKINLIFINVSSSIYKILLKCGLDKHFIIYSKEETLKLNQYN